MRKSISTLLLAAVLLPIVAEERPIPDSKAWRKPAAVSESAVQQFKPEWKNNSIIAGNKKVVFADNGMIQVWTSGRLALEISGYFSVRTAQKKTFWAGADSKLFKITNTREGNSLVTAGDLTVEGKTWRAFTQKAELTPEGMIRISLNWQKPDPALNWTFTPSIIMIGSYDALGGSLFKFDQRSLTLPVANDPDAKKHQL